MTESVRRQLELYDQGLGSNRVAKIMGVHPTTVTLNVKKYGTIRKGFGMVYEEKVAKYMQNAGKTVIRTRSIDPFDMLIDGEKVDVKSAKCCPRTKQSGGGYGFHMNYSKGRTSEKNIQESCDYYILVFTDRPGVPMYRLNAKDVKVEKLLRITWSLYTKYNLQFIGNLD